MPSSNRRISTPCRTASCRRRGLSLLELTAVLLLLAIVAAVIIPRLAENASESRKNACYTYSRDIEVQVELWRRNKNTWPALDLSDIGADPTYFPDGLPVCPLDGTRYVLDGATHRVTGHDHESP